MNALGLLLLHVPDEKFFCHLAWLFGGGGATAHRLLAGPGGPSGVFSCVFNYLERVWVVLFRLLPLH